MATQKTPRQMAFEAGARRYTPTKPCKYGHTSERYTSTGGCVQCADDKQASIKQQVREGRILANTKKFEPGRVWSGIVRPQHHDMFKQLSDICAWADPEQIAQCEAFIYMIRQQTRVLG